MAYGYKIKRADRNGELSSLTASEWTPRGGRRKYQGRARQRARQQMLFSLAMASGFFAHPYGLSEAAIVTKGHCHKCPEQCL